MWLQRCIGSQVIILSVVLNLKLAPKIYIRNSGGGTQQWSFNKVLPHKILMHMKTESTMTAWAPQTNSWLSVSSFINDCVTLSKLINLPEYFFFPRICKNEIMAPVLKKLEEEMKCHIVKCLAHSRCSKSARCFGSHPEILKNNQENKYISQFSFCTLCCLQLNNCYQD